MTFTLLAHLISVAAATGVRASLGLLALALAARIGWFELAPPMDWLASNPGIAVLVALAALDELVEHDEDLRELLVLANAGVRGAAGAAAAWGIEGGLGDQAPDWLVWILGFGISIGVHLLRARLHEALSGFGDGLHSPRTWLVILESGGVLGLIVALALAPILVGVFVLGSIAVGVALVLVARLFEAHRGRRPCPNCNHRAREDASLCPNCRTTLQVARWRT